MENFLVDMPKVEDSYVIGNFHTICRTCLIKSSFMVDIFKDAGVSGDDETEVPLTCKLAECLELKVNPNDGLPERLCTKCFFKIEMCYEFKLRSIENECRLRQLSYISEPENSKSSELSSCNSQEPQTSYVNKLENLKSSQLSIYNYNSEEPQTNNVNDLENPKPAIYNYNSQESQTKPEDYIVEDSVVMVVDPNNLYESSGESETAQQVDQAMSEIPDGESIPGSISKNVFMCQYCDKAFVVEEKCKEHEQICHDATLPYRCIECSLVFAQRTHYVQHSKLVHGNKKPYHCPDCEKTFCRRSDLKKHCIVHTGIKPYHCHYCLKSFSRNTNLSKHLRIHAAHKPHMCHLCPRSFVAKTDLQRHMLGHSGIKPYACRKCPSTFQRRDKLVKHEERHGPVSQESRPNCSANDQDINDNNMVIDVNPYNNLITSPTNAEYDLPHAPDHMLEENSLFNQIKEKPSTSRKHPQSSPPKQRSTSNRNKPKKIKCYQCLKKFSSLDSYKTHVSIDHIGSRVFQTSFQCKVCFKKFPQQKELNQHAIVHSSEVKLFSSNQCDKKFVRKDKLDIFQQSHEYLTVNNMPCVECGATFEKKASLVAHIKSHFTDNFEDKDTETGIKKEEDEPEFCSDEKFYSLDT